MKRRRLYLTLVIVGAAIGLGMGYLAYRDYWPMYAWRNWRVRKAMRRASVVHIEHRDYDHHPPRSETWTLSAPAFVRELMPRMKFDWIGGKERSLAAYILRFEDHRGDTILEICVNPGGGWTVEGFSSDRARTASFWEFLEKGDWRKNASK